jgi:predicted nucleotidyltransferase
VPAQVSKAELIQQALEVLEIRPQVLEAYLFGSRARDAAGPLSDVDVAVYVEPTVLDQPGFGIDAELSSELQAALGRSDVDVVLLNRASPLLYHRVLRDGVRILSRFETATTTREGYALSRYCDYLPQLRKIEALHQARIEAGRFGR